MVSTQPLDLLVSATEPRSFCHAIGTVEVWLSEQGETTVKRPLYGALSRITRKLYGEDNKCTFTQPLAPEQRAALQKFLNPNGIFFRKLLQLHDRSMLYEIKPDQLPAPSRKAIQNLDWSQLPALYNQRLQEDSKSRAIGHLIATPGRAGRQPTFQLMFNMFEFYIFSFALCANQKVPASTAFNAPSNANNSRQVWNSVTQLSKAVTGPRQRNLSTVPMQSTGLNPLYFELVAAILQFFLPAVTPQDNDNRPLQKPNFGTPLRERFMQPNTPGSLSSPVHRVADKVEHMFRHGDPQRTPSKPSPPVPSVSSATGNVFTIRELDHSQRRLASEFAIAAFVEVWLCQNEPTEQASPTKSGQSKPPYIRPTDAQMICIGSLVTMTVTGDFYETYRATADRNRETVAYESYSARGRAYNLVQPKLYWFLRMAFDNWSRDDSIISVVDVWLKYIAPWQRNSPSAKYSDQWLQFVSENFMFYTVLLAKFAQRAAKFDVYSSVRPVNAAAGTKTINKGYLDIVERVFAVFNDEMLVSVLQAVETAMFSLDNHLGYGPKSIPRDLSKLYQGSTAHSKVLQGLSNSGHASRTRISQLGEKSDLKPIFLIPSGRTIELRNRAAPEGTAEEILALVAGLMESSRKLRAQLDGKSSVRQPAGPTSPSLQRSGSFYSGGTPNSYTPPSRLISPLRFPRFPTQDPAASALGRWLWQCLCAWLVFSISTTMQLLARGYELAREQYTGIENRKPTEGTGVDPKLSARNIERLDRCVEAILAVWGGDLKRPEIQTNARAGASVPSSPTASTPPSRRQSTTNRGAEDEVVFTQIAPNIFAPEEYIDRDGKAVLTARGREQLKSGLRMSGRDNVPIIPSDRARGLAMSYEVKSLVKFWLWTADRLDEKYASLRRTYPEFPELPSFTWLRCLASKPNLACLALLAFALWILGWLISAMASGIAESNAAHVQSQARYAQMAAQRAKTAGQRMAGNVKHHGRS
ncbi:sphingomyelin phosphodiesterase 4, neutral membrane (neutral sphingomyelinase-3) [Thoreauomyces humboldtii]|nr:sphingomyelin phosphodiesterase 4, neutral membrane (neutral sphingomyelinase-3) [Thoreauomyces humboldtii]